MSHFTVKRRRATRPSIPVGIDKGNPITRDLTFAYLPGLGELDLTGNCAFETRAANVVIGADYLKPNGAGTSYLLFDGEPVDETGDLTIVADIDGKSNIKGCLISQGAAVNGSWSVYTLFDGTNHTVYFADENGSTIASYAFPSTSNERHTIGIAFSGSTIHFALDGQTSTSSGSYSLSSISSAKICINARYQWSSFPDYLNGNDRIHSAYIFNRQLSVAELSEVTKNQYQLLQPQTQYLPTTVAASTVTGVLQRKHRWTRKPPNAEGVIRHDVPSNALGCFPFSTAGRLNDLSVNQNNLTSNGTVTWGPTSQGMGWTFGDTTSDYFTTGDIGSVPSQWTYEFVVKINSTDAQYLMGIQESPGDTTYDRGIGIDGSSQFYGYIFAGPSLVSAQTVEAGKIYHVIISTDGTSTAHITVNGVNGTIGSTSTPGYSGYSTPEFIIGRGRDSTDTDVGTDATILSAVFYDKYFNPAEARERTRNLWGYTYQPQTQLIPYSTAAAAGGGATGKSNPLFGPLGGPLYGAIC